MVAFEKLFREVMTETGDSLVASARTAWDNENNFWTLIVVCEKTGLSRSALNELRNNPRKNFPKPVAFDTKPRWIAAEIMQWARENRMVR